MGKLKTTYIQQTITDKNWDSKSKEFAKSFNHTCWVCDVVDLKCKAKIKFISTQPVVELKDTVCVCPDCYKAVNKMMFDESEFIQRLNDLKRIMYKNGLNRILTYSQIKDFKENYLNEQIELYKKTKNPGLQHDLIKKVLSLPV